KVLRQSPTAPAPDVRAPPIEFGEYVRPHPVQVHREPPHLEQPLTERILISELADDWVVDAAERQLERREPPAARFVAPDSGLQEIGDRGRMLDRHGEPAWAGLAGHPWRPAIGSVEKHEAVGARLAAPRKK